MMASIAKVKMDLTLCLRRALTGRSRVDIGDERSVIAYAAEEGSDLFDVGGHRNSGEGGDLVGVRANASGRNGVSQVAPSLALAGKRLGCACVGVGIGLGCYRRGKPGRGRKR